MEKDVLSIWKDRIAKESKHGDKKKACDAAGTTATTYLTAMKKEKFNDLTEGEQRTLEKLIERLDTRKEEILKIQEKYAKA